LAGFQVIISGRFWVITEALTAQQSAKGTFGGALIAARLQQNIDDITVLIHARYRSCCWPLILTKSSSRYQLSPSRPCFFLRRLT